MLRLAGRDACKRLLEEWQAAGEPTATAEVEAACARVLADPDLRPEALTARIEAEARGLLDGTPGEALTRLLAALEDQAQQTLAHEDPGNWARQALTRVREWSGAGLTAGPVREAGEWRKSRLSRALEAAAQKVAAEWADSPGRGGICADGAPRAAGGGRGGGAGAVPPLLHRGGRRQRRPAGAAVGPRQQAQQHLEAALTQCVVGAGGFSFFGGKNRRLLRVFMDHLAAYARQCLVEDLGAAVQQFLAALDGKLHERLRDLSFCRQRLRHLQVTLEAGAVGDGDDTPHALEASPNSPPPSTESFWDAIRQSGTTRVVLPGGETDLDRAAGASWPAWAASEWGALDQALQDGVLGPLGGLHRACTSSADLMRGVAAPLLEQAAASLGSHLPVTDVAQVEFALAQATGGDLGGQAEGYFRNAAPLVSSRTGRGTGELPPDPGRGDGQGLRRGGAASNARVAGGAGAGAGGSDVLSRAGAARLRRPGAPPEAVPGRLRGDGDRAPGVAARPLRHPRLDAAGAVSRLRLSARATAPHDMRRHCASAKPQAAWESRPGKEEKTAMLELGTRPLFLAGTPNAGRQPLQGTGASDKVIKDI